MGSFLPDLRLSELGCPGSVEGCALERRAGAGSEESPARGISAARNCSKTFCFTRVHLVPAAPRMQPSDGLGSECLALSELFGHLPDSSQPSYPSVLPPCVMLELPSGVRNGFSARLSAEGPGLGLGAVSRLPPPSQLHAGRVLAEPRNASPLWCKEAAL